jgi:anti-sigma factor RsiW
MTCTETQVFVDAFIDGELDLARSIELERHLESCPSCSALFQSQKAAHSALADPALRHTAPAAVRKKVHAALAAEVPRPLAESQNLRRAQPTSGWFRWQWPAAAAGVLAGVAALIFVLRLPPAADPLERELVDSHIRSLMPNHLMDVVSTDQHTVKPWFAGKVDFSPPVKDLAADGFPLIGGRVDYVDQHSAAVMVYKRNQHVINVFVWPVAGREDIAPRTRADQGYNMIEVVHGGMEYWAVSDLNQAELRQITDLLTK